MARERHADTLSGVTIRPLRTEEDFEACVRLQRDTWGEDFRELVPPAMLMIAQKVGGVAAGAFDARRRLVGFVFGLTGLRDGEPAHWSHMLAVTRDLWGHGIGRRLKHYQRDQLTALHVPRMYWTYDPLVARNAHLNLNRLGARVEEYVEDMYGRNPMSKTDSIIGSDRLVVRWDFDAESVGMQHGEIAREAVVTLKTDAPEEAHSIVLPPGDSLYLEIPADIQALKLIQPELARAWRLFTRRAFIHYLERGYSVRGLAREPDTGRSYYRLRREDW